MAAGVQRRGGRISRKSAELDAPRLAPPAATTLAVSDATLESLAEISGWLGTYRERLKIARSDEVLQVRTVVNQLEWRLRLRRAELA